MRQQHHKDSYKLQVTSCKSEKNLKLHSSLVTRYSLLVTHHVLRIANYGFTLVELMIAIVVGMLIIAGTFASYISQQRSFVAQDQVAEINYTSKIALDMIVNDIRETGFGVPDNLTGIARVPGCLGINGYTQKINFIAGTDDLTAAPDRITILGGFRLVGATFAAVAPGSTTLTLTDTTVLKSSGTFKEDRGYITIGGISFTVVDSIAENTLTLNSSTPIDKTFPVGVPVYLIENVTYQVVNGELQKVRRLAGAGCTTASDTDVIAQNIEDLQFVLVDSDGNGATDRIRVNILAQTARPDPDFQGQGNPPPTIENRDHASTNDSLRRRWWQMEVALRNPQ